jgi:hypothetical protein
VLLLIRPTRENPVFFIRKAWFLKKETTRIEDERVRDFLFAKEEKNIFTHAPGWSEDPAIIGNTPLESISIVFFILLFFTFIIVAPFIVERPEPVEYHIVSFLKPQG